MANDNQSTRFARDQSGRVVGIDLVAGRTSDLDAETLAALLRVRAGLGRHVHVVTDDDRNTASPLS